MADISTRSFAGSVGVRTTDLPYQWDEAEEVFENLGERCKAHEEEDDFVPLRVRTDPEEIIRARQWAKQLDDEQVVLTYRNRHNF